MSSAIETIPLNRTLSRSGGGSRRATPPGLCSRRTNADSTPMPATTRARSAGSAWSMYASPAEYTTMLSLAMTTVVFPRCATRSGLDDRLAHELKARCKYVHQAEPTSPAKRAVNEPAGHRVMSINLVAFAHRGRCLATPSRCESPPQGHLVPQPRRSLLHPDGDAAAKQEETLDLMGRAGAAAATTKRWCSAGATMAVTSTRRRLAAGHCARRSRSPIDVAGQCVRSWSSPVGPQNAQDAVLYTVAAFTGIRD